MKVLQPASILPVSGLCLVLLVTGAPVTATEPAGARAFALQVIRAEVAPAQEADSVGFTRWLTPRFRRAVESDSADGEIGLLDHDPVCMCQDPEGAPLVLMAVANAGNDPQKSLVTVRAGKWTGRWSLVRGPTGWQIADISESNWLKGGSILAALEREAIRRRKGR